MPEQTSLEIKRTRQFVGSALKMAVILDGKEITHLRNGQSYSIEAEAEVGRHELYIKTPHRSSDIYQFNLEQNSPLRIEISFNRSSLHIKTLFKVLLFSLSVNILYLFRPYHQMTGDEIFIFSTVTLMIELYPLFICGFYLDNKTDKECFKLYLSREASEYPETEPVFLDGHLKRKSLKLKILLGIFCISSPFLMVGYIYSLPFIFEFASRFFRHPSIS